MLQSPAQQSPVITTEARCPTEHHYQNAGQSVQASNLSSVSLDIMFRVATVVQQTLTEFNGVVSEEAKIVAITTIFLNLMKQNGHWIS
jgi:hypothetical protein